MIHAMVSTRRSYEAQSLWNTIRSKLFSQSILFDRLRRVVSIAMMWYPDLNLYLRLRIWNRTNHGIRQLVPQPEHLLWYCCDKRNYGLQPDGGLGIKTCKIGATLFSDSIDMMPIVAAVVNCHSLLDQRFCFIDELVHGAYRRNVVCESTKIGVFAQVTDSIQLDVSRRFGQGVMAPSTRFQYYSYQKRNIIKSIRPRKPMKSRSHLVHAPDLAFWELVTLQ